MSATRKSMHRDSLNMLLFLKVSRHLWPNPPIIQKILNERKVAGSDDEDNNDDDDEEVDDNADAELWLKLLFF